MVPSYTCEITNLRTRPSSTTTTTNRPYSSRQAEAANHHIELFIFLEDVDHREKSGLGKNCLWKESIELHHKLKEAFQRLAVDHSRKFHQAVHSALNKLICNYGSHAKVCKCESGLLPITNSFDDLYQKCVALSCESFTDQEHNCYSHSTDI